MLTKQEREEIAERFRNYDKAEYVTLYSGMYDGLLGEHVPKETTVKKDRMELASRILDLCDTSNMVELPLDKDGEVIKVGDTLYYGRSTTYKVKKIIYKGNKWEIQFFDEKFCIPIYADPNDLTHKKPVTIASLVGEIKRTLSQNTIMNKEATSKLWEITDKIEMLGDSDD